MHNKTNPQFPTTNSGISTKTNEFRTTVERTPVVRTAYNGKTQRDTFVSNRNGNGRNTVTLLNGATMLNTVAGRFEKVVKPFILTFTLLIFMSLAAAFSTVEVKAQVTHNLNTISDFNVFVNRVNGTNGYAYHSYLGETVNLNVNGVILTTPIGTDTRPFRGLFNGNCRKIELQLNFGWNTPNPRERVALFGNVDAGIIINVITEGYAIGTQYVAGIVGTGNYITVKNSTNFAKIEVSRSNNAYYGFAGGIVGWVWNGALIDSCTNAGRIEGNWHIGGILGVGYLGITLRNNCNIGTVYAAGSSAGGIVACIGYSSQTSAQKNIIEHNMNAGFVSVGSKNSADAGGIVGVDAGYHNTIRYCLNVGVVRSNDKNIDSISSSSTSVGSGSTTGAILGNRINNNTIVTDCYYDRQMYYNQQKQANPANFPNWYTAIGGVPDNNISIQGFNTSSMLGTSLQSRLGTAYWIFTTGAYPVLKNSGNCGTCNRELHNIAGSPLILGSSLNTVNYVTVRYSANRLNNTNIVWRSQNGYWGGNPIPGTTSDVLYAEFACGGNLYQKEIPIRIPSGTNWNKTTSQNEETASEYSFAFTVGEISPTIVTDNAFFDVSTIEEGNLEVSIWDATGAKVFDVEQALMPANTERRVQLSNLSSLASGTYYVVVYFDNKTVMRKFIKQ